MEVIESLHALAALRPAEEQKEEMNFPSWELNYDSSVILPVACSMHRLPKFGETVNKMSVYTSQQTRFVAFQRSAYENNCLLFSESHESYNAPQRGQNNPYSKLPPCFQHFMTHEVWFLDMTLDN
jgi:hypothetical protein